MADVEYSPRKVDLFYPARRGHFFEGIALDNDTAVCAEMCRLAYSRREPLFSFDRDVITQSLKAVDFVPQFFESRGTPDGRGTHCFLAVSDARKLAIVAFRGTDANDPTDLFDDCDVLQEKWEPGGRVHAGFAHALAHVQNDLLPALESVKYKKIYVGHSLGAAMATLLASLKRPDWLFTIGCPRVGDKDFVATLSGVKSSRYVDCCDGVTRVPPEVVPGCGTYAHVGVPYYIDRNRAVILDPGDDFIRQDRFEASPAYIAEYGWKTGNVAVRELADHTPINYVAAIHAGLAVAPAPQRRNLFGRLFGAGR